MVGRSLSFKKKYLLRPCGVWPPSPPFPTTRIYTRMTSSSSTPAWAPLIWTVSGSSAPQRALPYAIGDPRSPPPACTRDTPPTWTPSTSSHRRSGGTRGTVPAGDGRNQNPHFATQSITLPLTCCLPMSGNRAKSSGKISENRSARATLQCS